MCIYQRSFPFLCSNRVNSCRKHCFFVLLFFFWSLSGDFSQIDCSPCLIVWRCPIVLFFDFLRCLLMIFYLRHGQVISKPCLIALSRLDVVGIKSAAWMYCVSSGLVFWSIMLFFTASDCCISRGASTILFCFFLVPFIIYFPFL